MTPRNQSIHVSVALKTGASGCSPRESILRLATPHCGTVGTCNRTKATKRWAGVPKQQIEQLKHTTCYCLGHLASHLTCVAGLDADALDEVVTSMTHRFNCPQTSSTFLCQRSIQSIGSEQTPGGTPLVARERQSVCSASQGTNCKQPCNTARISQLSVVSQTFRVWK